MRSLAFAAFVAAAVIPVTGTTLQQLTLDAMIQKSTAIVRGKAQLSSAAARSSVIYTHYLLKVTEQWKGAPATQFDVAVPGGSVNGIRQTYSGTPVFADGQDYVFFLWTSRTGLTQVIGLSQGLFSVTPTAAGVLYVTRAASTEPVLNLSGSAVTDPQLNMPLADLKARVVLVLSGKGGQ